MIDDTEKHGTEVIYSPDHMTCSLKTYLVRHYIVRVCVEGTEDYVNATLSRYDSPTGEPPFPRVLLNDDDGEPRIFNLDTGFEYITGETRLGIHPVDLHELQEGVKHRGRVSAAAFQRRIVDAIETGIVTSGGLAAHLGANVDVIRRWYAGSDAPPIDMRPMVVNLLDRLQRERGEKTT